MSSRPQKEIEEELKQTGDLELAGKLYRDYMHLVYGLCLKYLRNRDDSQDAVMQIFEKITESLKTHEVKNFKSWLYVVSKNHCLMELRSRKNKMRSQVKNIDDVAVENVLLMHHDNDSPVLEEDLSKLEWCIEQLQNEQKTCIQLFYLEKRSYKEIVEVTTFELKKVKSYVQNGKRNLKICMEKNR